MLVSKLAVVYKKKGPKEINVKKIEKLVQFGEVTSATLEKNSFSIRFFLFVH